MSKTTGWLNNINTEIDIIKFTGFVYEIKHISTDKFYIGQKGFWSKQTKKPLKNRINKRHSKTESNWKDYWGSSKELQEDIKKFGKDQFTRKILYLCKSKAQMNYYETKEQFNRDVLFNSKSYNCMINCRISRNQLEKIGPL